ARGRRRGRAGTRTALAGTRASAPRPPRPTRGTGRRSRPRSAPGRARTARPRPPRRPPSAGSPRRCARAATRPRRVDSAATAPGTSSSGSAQPPPPRGRQRLVAAPSGGVGFRLVEDLLGRVGGDGLAELVRDAGGLVAGDRRAGPVRACAERHAASRRVFCYGRMLVGGRPGRIGGNHRLLVPRTAGKYEGGPGWQHP